MAFDVKVVQDILGPKVKGKEDKIKSVILMTNVLSYERSALLIQGLLSIDLEMYLENNELLIKLIQFSSWESHKEEISNWWLRRKSGF